MKKIVAIIPLIFLISLLGCINIGGKETTTKEAATLYYVMSYLSSTANISRYTVKTGQPFVFTMKIVNTGDHPMIIKRVGLIGGYSFQGYSEKVLSYELKPGLPYHVTFMLTAPNYATTITIEPYICYDTKTTGDVVLRITSDDETYANYYANGTIPRRSSNSPLRVSFSTEPIFLARKENEKYVADVYVTITLSRIGNIKVARDCDISDNTLSGLKIAFIMPGDAELEIENCNKLIKGADPTCVITPNNNTISINNTELLKLVNSETVIPIYGKYIRSLSIPLDEVKVYVEAEYTIYERLSGMSATIRVT